MNGCVSEDSRSYAEKDGGEGDTRVFSLEIQGRTGKGLGGEKRRTTGLNVHTRRVYTCQLRCYGRRECVCGGVAHSAIG